MQVSGLTFIRNGCRLGYPFVEAIKSALPLCDEFIVVVGESDDGTREAVAAIGDPRIKIVDSVWPSNIEPGYAVLAQQTNLGLLQCQGDWVVYVQGNEVFHEDDLPTLKALMEQSQDRAEVEGILVERRTFYGDYEHFFRVYPDRFKYVVRLFKTGIGVASVGDAMTFARFKDYGRVGRDLKCIDSGVEQYRYGCVLTAEAARAKREEAAHFADLSNEFELDNYYQDKPRQYFAEFKGQHPAVMAERIRAHQFHLKAHSERWRTKLKFKEYKRLLESAIYRLCGMPRWRIKRSKVLGQLVKKDRQE
jgi:glycosyltransferase involved in cell wall biosynthesis